MQHHLALEAKAAFLQRAPGGGIGCAHQADHPVGMEIAEGEGQREWEAAQNVIFTEETLRTCGPWYTASILLPSGSSRKAA